MELDKEEKRNRTFCAARLRRRFLYVSMYPGKIIDAYYDESSELDGTYSIVAESSRDSLNEKNFSLEGLPQLSIVIESTFIDNIDNYARLLENGTYFGPLKCHDKPE